MNNVVTIYPVNVHYALLVEILSVYKRERKLKKIFRHMHTTPGGVNHVRADVLFNCINLSCFKPNLNFFNVIMFDYKKNENYVFNTVHISKVLLDKESNTWKDIVRFVFYWHKKIRADCIDSCNLEILWKKLDNFTRGLIDADSLFHFTNGKFRGVMSFLNNLNVDIKTFSINYFHDLTPVSFEDKKNNHFIINTRCMVTDCSV